MKKFLLRVIKELHLSLWERGVGGGGGGREAGVLDML